ncbi:MAG: reverse transcriptase family protein, partial [Chitinophagales bacterium]
DKVSDNSYMLSMPSGGRRKFHSSKMRTFHPREDDTESADINLVGVIHEDGTEDFGEVVEIPMVDSHGDGMCDEISGVINKSCAHLTQEQKQELISVLIKHKHVFNNNPGSCRSGMHSIEVEKDVGIPRRKLYPIPLVYRDEVDKQIKNMLENDLIEPSVSKYAHPVVCVKKKDGSLRLAIDYRAVNSITVNQEYPMKIVSEVLLDVGAARYITTLDATQGYYQIPLADDGSRERSAFMTHSGLWQFKVMPFGLKCAAATYQRTMDSILAGLKFCSSYQDDTSVASNSWVDHLLHVDTVLGRINDSGLKLKLSKCNFAQEKVKFLGHIIGGGTHTPDMEKLKAITDWEFPKTKKQLRSMLGLISYYRMYVHNFAVVVKPLTDLTRGKELAKLQEPTPEALNALDKIKQLLTSPPILATPDFSLPFLLQADASKFGVGCCLSQVFNNQEKPIGYASCKLTDTQIRWSTIEREAYAIIFGLKKFDNIVYGRQIQIMSDHNPLAYLVDVAPENPKLVRWKLALDRYNIVKISFKRGADNGNCDALSRLPVD